MTILRSLVATSLLFCCAIAFGDDPIPPVPKKYALIIGLNDYRFAGSQIKRLSFAVNDAEDLELELKSQGYETTTLINEKATREDIVAELAKFAVVVQDSDSFLLYYAGHGVRNKRQNQKTYWLAYEASLTELDARGIRLPHLLDYLKDIQAGKKLILLDHCFSGDVRAEIGLNVGAASPGDTSRGESSGGVSIERRGAFDVDEVTTALIATSRGFAVFAAADRDAFEKEGHGVFTYALLDALRTQKADTNHNGSLTLPELRDYLAEAVRKRAIEQIGRAQIIMENSGGSRLNAWIVAANISGTDANLKPIVEKYLADLNAWSAQGLLTPEHKNWLAGKVTDWYEKIRANQEMERRDRKLISTIRDILDSAEIPDDLKPKYLAELVKG